MNSVKWLLTAGGGFLWATVLSLSGTSAFAVSQGGHEPVGPAGEPSVSTLEGPQSDSAGAGMAVEELSDADPQSGVEVSPETHSPSGEHTDVRPGSSELAASEVVSSTVEVTEDESWDGITLVRDAAFTDAPMVVVSGDANLTLTDSTIDGAGVTVVLPDAATDLGYYGSAISIVDNATVTLGDGTIITGNNLIQGNINGPTYAPISVTDAATLVVDGATVTGNSSSGGSGGVSQLGADSTFTFESGTFENNHGHYGGAILVMRGNFIMNDGVIQNNTAYQGGGFAQGIYSASAPWMVQDSHSIFNGGVIQNNATTYRGGGAAFYRGTTEVNALQVLNNTATADDNPYSNNRDSYGGGFYVEATFNNQEPLYMSNVLFEDNHATYQGGALWLCSVGEGNVSNVTEGVAFINNTVSGVWDDTPNPVGGSSVAIHRSAWNDRSLSFAPRALGGGVRSIYNDMEPRYEAGDSPLPLDFWEVVSTDQWVGVKTEIGEQGAQQARAVAKVVFRGNRAGGAVGWGGAIANNGNMIFGVLGERDLSVSKIWDDGGQEDLRPQEIVVELLGSDGFVLEVVTLSEANHWQHTFEHLPLGLDFSVREQVPDGYEAIYERNEDAQGNITYTVTNTPMQPQPPEPPIAPEPPVVPEFPEPPVALEGPDAGLAHTGVNVGGLLVIVSALLTIGVAAVSRASRRSG